MSGAKPWSRACLQKLRDSLAGAVCRVLHGLRVAVPISNCRFA
ncbi:hypothetical protein [Cohnella sp. GCM10012308]